ncbi:MAG: M18 family aminopeptidase [Anaerolineae bacterium]
MTNETAFAQDLIDFIHNSPSSFHVVQNIEAQLAAAGFSKLVAADRWTLDKGGKYYLTRNDSAIIAFVVGGGDIEQAGFRLVAAHTDAPTFRIKPAPEIVAEKAYLKLNTETYDGPILNTWLDRPLSMAGRVSLRTEDPLYPETRLVSFADPLLIIPNQSLHMNRKVNEGIELDKQKDMLPLLARVTEEFEKEGYLAGLLADKLGVDAGRVVDFDLFLHEYAKGCLVGLNKEFISSTRLDDLAMVHAGLHALLDAEPGTATSVLACYDNEEVGSRTKQGAASPIMSTLLERIALSQGKDREDFFRAVHRSFLVSADMGHGLHPNAADKHDPVHKPILNKGPMIKVAANQNFTTDADTAAVYEALCRQEGIPVQRFVSRSDLRGGSTIGPISAGHLDMRSLDVGNPAMAMHSIRELCGVLDHTYIKKSFQALFGA